MVGRRLRAFVVAVGITAASAVWATQVLSSSREQVRATMKIDGHYDESCDVAWLRFEGYHPATVASEEAQFGLRGLDPSDEHVVSLEYWRASARLPAELLRMLPSPPVGVPG